MRNIRMKEKLEAGTAVDVSHCDRTPAGDYILEVFVEDIDYCVAGEEEWIWSVGRHLQTGQIVASKKATYYLNPEYECLFLR